MAAVTTGRPQSSHLLAGHIEEQSLIPQPECGEAWRVFVASGAK